MMKIIQLTVPVRFIFDHPSYTFQNRKQRRGWGEIRGEEGKGKCQQKTGCEYWPGNGIACQTNTVRQPTGYRTYTLR
jgi:hypothetical protein